MINEPLNAVPDVPFGHLNPIWMEFKEKLEIEDKIWSFSGYWSSEWGWKKEYQGYVITINGIPKDFIVTVIKDLGHD